MATHAGFSRHIVIALPRLAVLQHGDQFFCHLGRARLGRHFRRDLLRRLAKRAITEEGIDHAARKPALTGNNAASALDHGAGIDGSVGTLAKDYLRNAGMQRRQGVACAAMVDKTVGAVKENAHRKPVDQTDIRRQ